MGIKMNKVRCLGQVLKINDYNPQKVYGQLKCFYCNADVSYVRAHKRSLGDKTIMVAHFFRLKNGTHEDFCKYTVDGAILDIVAGCADNELMTNQDNKFIVRLLLIADDTSDILDTKTNDESGQGKRNQNYISKGKKARYLSSMIKIMRLRTEVEKNSDLGEILELQFPKSNGSVTNIQWNNFYYEVTKEDYEKLLRYQEEQTTYHPICIEGFIKDVKNLGEYYILNLESVKLREDTNQNDERVSVSYFLHGKRVLQELEGKRGSRIVIYAQCRYNGSKQWASQKNGKDNKKQEKQIIYHQITGNIYDRRQMLIIDDI